MRFSSGDNDIPARKWSGNAAPEYPESGPRQPSSRGSAAAQCGKATSFRTIYFVLPRLCLGGGVASGITSDSLGKAEPYRTVRRQSRNVERLK